MPDNRGSDNRDSTVLIFGGFVWVLEIKKCHDKCLCSKGTYILTTVAVSVSLLQLQEVDSKAAYNYAEVCFV